jgi:hypothetical protein
MKDIIPSAPSSIATAGLVEEAGSRAAKGINPAPDLELCETRVGTGDTNAGGCADRNRPFTKRSYGMLAASCPTRNVVWGAESGTDRLVVAHKAHKERGIGLALCDGACPKPGG